ncbi:MAG: hypothetical protein L3J03_06390 [Desulfobacterales bacterium]|nr:hypothetical protein [Desulfobacterales bacterium]
MSRRSDMTTVIILTSNYKIKGDIGLIPGLRLTDYISGARDFIAVVDAEVSDLAGKQLLACGFINVHRRNIEVIMPVEDEGR